MITLALLVVRSLQVGWLLCYLSPPGYHEFQLITHSHVMGCCQWPSRRCVCVLRSIVDAIIVICACPIVIVCVCVWGCLYYCHRCHHALSSLLLSPACVSSLVSPLLLSYQRAMRYRGMQQYKTRYHTAVQEKRRTWDKTLCNMYCARSSRLY